MYKILELKNLKEKGFKGKVNFDIGSNIGIDEIEKVLFTSKMIHRFDKDRCQNFNDMNVDNDFIRNWTGRCGEIATKMILNNLGYILLKKPKHDAYTGYDQGDIHFIDDFNNKSIALISSRRMPFININDDFVSLIVKRQLYQYKDKSDYIIPVFISFNKYKYTYYKGNKIFTEFDFIIPSMLNNNDLKKYLNSDNYEDIKQNKFLHINKKVNIKMRVDNIVIRQQYLKSCDTYLKKANITKI